MRCPTKPIDLTKLPESPTSRLYKAGGVLCSVKVLKYDCYPDIHMVSAPAFSFPLNPIKYAAKPVPSLEEYEQLWAAWDLVTKSMIPPEELLSKPINLRNCCLFYLGHIPTFLDIHLTRATDGVPTEPSAYRRIFERGIDPDVDNPDHCHPHSEIPDSWPPAGEIMTYQERVRDRTRRLYKLQAPEKDRKVGRALWLGFEHEGKQSSA